MTTTTTLENYYQLALRTEAQKHTTHAEIFRDRTVHCVLGLTSELIELRGCLQGGKIKDAVNFMEEIGDLFWYVGLGFNRNVYRARFHIHTNRNFAYRFYSAEEFIRRVEDYVSTLANLAKREIFYGTDQPDDFWFCLANLEDLLVNYHLSEGDLLNTLSRNIAKLYKRFPEKFTIEAAINRDLEAERKVLE